MVRIVYVNGKFLAQRLTGVQRVAHELLWALDEHLARTPAAGLNCVVLHPPGCEVPPWRAVQARAVGPAGLAPTLWEQLLLPWHARAGLLLNLSGSAPWWGRRQICMLHDAAVFDWPQAYGWRFRFWYRLLFKRLAKHALLLLTPSQFSARRLAVCLPRLAPTRLQVLPGAANHVLRLPPDPKVLQVHGLVAQGFLLTVASSNPSKNLAGLLRAHGSWALRQQYPLVLIGVGNASVFASAALRPCGDGSQRVLGAVSDAELAALYQQALGFVLPSYYEGFGLPPLEAMQLGCPVAVAKRASLPEVCGDAALYFDPDNACEIQQVLTLLVSDAARRRGLRSQGLNRAAQFSWQRSATSLLALLLQQA